MKNFKIPVILGAIFVLFSSLIISESDQQEASEEFIVHLESSKEFKSVDELKAVSDLVVRGTVIKTSPHGTAEEKHILAISESYLTDYNETTITVYEFTNTLKLNGEYLLFLEGFDSILSDEIIYTSVSKESILKLNDLETKNNGQFKNQEINIIIEELEKSQKKALNILPKKVTKFQDTTIAINSSDYIIDCTILSKKYVNENASFYKIEVNSFLKGVVREITVLALPSTVEVNDRYLILLNDLSTSLELSSKKDSIINYTNTTLVDEFLTKIN